MTHQPPPPGPEPYPGQPSGQDPGQSGYGGYSSYPSYPQPGGTPPYPGGGGYYGTPPKKSNTTRNVIIGVVVAVVLLCGGSIAAFVALIVNAGQNLDDEFNDDYKGSEDRPLTVAEGEAFTIRGMDYAKGWTIDPSSDYSTPGISGLTTENNRDDGESEDIYLDFTFLQGDTVLADVTCRTPASVSPGRSASMKCDGFADAPRGYDTIEVYDTSIFE